MKIHGELHGELHGEPVGAARGLLAARMLSLPGRSHWYCLGVALVAVDCCRIGILRVECSGT